MRVNFVKTLLHFVLVHQYKFQEGFVVNNGDFILVAECPNIGEYTLLEESL